jgi:hypothetical protein
MPLKARVWAARTCPWGTSLCLLLSVPFTLPLKRSF